MCVLVWIRYYDTFKLQCNNQIQRAIFGEDRDRANGEEQDVTDNEDDDQSDEEFYMDVDGTESGTF